MWLIGRRPWLPPYSAVSLTCEACSPGGERRHRNRPITEQSSRGDSLRMGFFVSPLYCLFVIGDGRWCRTKSARLKAFGTLPGRKTYELPRPQQHFVDGYQTVSSCSTEARTPRSREKNEIRADIKTGSKQALKMRTLKLDRIRLTGGSMAEK